MDLSGTFSFYIDYSGNATPIQADVSNNLPIINVSSSFTYDLSMTHVTANSKFYVNVSFTYTDKSSGDGLSFNNVYNYYNGFNGLTITSFGTIPLSRSGYQFYNLTNLFAITAIDVPTILSGTNLGACFQGCVNFNSPIENWVTTNVTDMNNMFLYAYAFNNGDISNNGSNPLTWDTSNVTNMSNMFNIAISFNQDISGWNTGAVTTMYYMFFNALAFNNGDPSNNGSKPLTWDTSGVLTMAYMFSSAISFNQDISGWNTGAVQTMSSMFNSASSFNNGDPSNNGLKPLTWDTSGVLNMNNMFYDAHTFNQDISGWNTSSVTNMNNMFGFASAFNNGDISNNGLKPLTWDTSRVLYMNSMFYLASAFNQDISKWVTTNVTDMNAMFYYATVFNNGDPSNNGLQPLTWDTSGVLNMSNMFNNATAFNQDISGWNTGAVTDMNYMFYYATVFNNGDSPGGITHPMPWNISGLLENPQPDFSTRSALTYPNSPFYEPLPPGTYFSFYIDYSGNATPTRGEVSNNLPIINTFGSFTIHKVYTVNDVSNQHFIVDVSFTYIDNNSEDGLSFLYVYDYYNGFNGLTITSFGTIPLSNSGYQFSNLTNLFAITAIDVPTILLNTTLQYCFAYSINFNSPIENWVTTNVTDMNNMFYNATVFNNGDISNNGARPLTWDTSGVLDMNSMFSGASSFNQDISGWITGAVTNMNSMFFFASAFNQDISGWNTGAVTNMNSMFFLASAFNQDISGWNHTSTQYTFVFSLNPAHPVPYDGAPLSPSNKLSATTIDISSNVTNIGQGAFLGCTSLISVTIPVTVTSISPGAFTGCVSLPIVNLLDSSINSLPYQTFFSCTSLTTASLHDTTTVIDTSCFAGCRLLSTLYTETKSIPGEIGIPSEIVTVGDYAFENCTSITSVIFSNVGPIQSIGKGAFNGCINLTSVTLPDAGGIYAFPYYYDIVPGTTKTYQQFWGIQPGATIIQA